MPHRLAARSVMVGRIASDHRGVLAIFLQQLGLDIGPSPSFAGVAWGGWDGCEDRSLSGGREQRDDLLGTR